MINKNQRNAELITKYDSVIFLQLSGEHKKLAAKVFKETYKWAQYIHGDKTAAIFYDEGIDLDAVASNLTENKSTSFNGGLTN